MMFDPEEVERTTFEGIQSIAPNSSGTAEIDSANTRWPNAGVELHTRLFISTKAEVN